VPPANSQIKNGRLTTARIEVEGLLALVPKLRLGTHSSPGSAWQRAKRRAVRCHSDNRRVAKQSFAAGRSQAELGNAGGNVASSAYDAATESRIPKSRCVEWAERGASRIKNARRLHTLALAHYRAGDLNKSRQALKQSMGRPWRAQVLNGIALGLVEHKAGNIEAARSQLQRVRDWLKKTEARRLKNGSPPFLLADWLEFNVLLPELDRAVSTSGVRPSGNAKDRQSSKHQEK
jgi:hypothetical protein